MTPLLRSGGPAPRSSVEVIEELQVVESVKALFLPPEVDVPRHRAARAAAGEGGEKEERNEKGGHEKEKNAVLLKPLRVAGYHTLRGIAPPLVQRCSGS